MTTNIVTCKMCNKEFTVIRRTIGAGSYKSNTFSYSHEGKIVANKWFCNKCAKLLTTGPAGLEKIRQQCMRK